MSDLLPEPSVVDAAVQGAILVLTGGSALLISSARHRGLGYALGLASQPFWLYSTFDAGQWGMFILSVVYSVAWVNGLWGLRHGRP